MPDPGLRRASDIPAAPAAEPAAAPAKPAEVEREAEGTAAPEMPPVSLIQVALVGRSLMEAALLPPAPRTEAKAADGEGPRRAERVLKPWGVPMLPSDEPGRSLGDRDPPLAPEVAAR